MSAEEKETMPVSASRISLSDVETYFGSEVDDFIVTECRNIGVWTEKRPENHKRTTLSDRCTLM